MIGFRTKILVGDLLLFLFFVSLLFPFVDHTTGSVFDRSKRSRSQELIAILRKEGSREGMVEYLNSHKQYFFLRFTLYDHLGRPFYDTHILGGDEQTPKEVIEAFKYGEGAGEHYTSYFHESLTYVATSFEVGGTEYVLRMGLPSSEIQHFSHQFRIGFLCLAFLFLLLYSFMTWGIMTHLTRPIRFIIKAIQPFQEGKEEFLPRIEIGKEIKLNNEFGKLAQTLNALGAKIQKQIEFLVRQRNESDAILESLGEGVVALDVDGRIVFANRAACSMIGAPRNQMVDLRFSEIKTKRGTLTLKCQGLVDRVLESREPAIQFFVIEDVPEMHFDLIAAPQTEHSGIILVIQDKTSDYKVVEMGKDFIANASHELRTPITVIRGFAETLHDVPHLSQEVRQEIAEKILKTSIRLELLVKSLLTLADIGHLTADHFHRVDLSLAVQNCEQQIHSAYPNLLMKVNQKVQNLFVNGDMDLIEMSLMNLLQNAVKYSPSPAEVEIDVDHVNGKAYLSVKDKGIGIPEKDLPYIFDRFYTVDKARSRKHGGTGLGLAITKTIIQKHGGTIQVESQLGQGSTFTIALPSIGSISKT